MAVTTDSPIHSRPRPAMCHSMSVRGPCRMVCGTATPRYQSKPNTGRTRFMVGVPSSVAPKKGVGFPAERMPCRNVALAGLPTYRAASWLRATTVPSASVMPAIQPAGRRSAATRLLSESTARMPRKA